MNVHIRKYIYAILLALGPIAAFYGFASQEEVVLWLGVGATVLAVPGNTLALKNLTKEGVDADGYAVVEQPQYLGKHGQE